MPKVTTLHLPTVLHYALSVSPRSILDIGVGTGTYGFLVVAPVHRRQTRTLEKHEWNAIIDGVEVFPAYHNSFGTMPTTRFTLRYPRN